MNRLPRLAVSLVALGLTAVSMTACNNAANPDNSSRAEAAQRILAAAMRGDDDQLLRMASQNMEEREDAAAALTRQAQPLGADYELDFTPGNSPQFQNVTARDSDGDSVTFAIAWDESGWRLVLGKAGPPKSPSAQTSSG